MPTIHELRAKARRLVRESRAKIHSITDDMPEAKARKIEREVNDMMLETDQIRDQIADLEDSARPGEREDDAPDPRRPRNDGRAYPNGFADYDDAGETRALPREKRFADWITEQRGASEFHALSPGRYLRAMILGPQTEIERRALSEGTDSAGGFTVPEILSARLIDRLRAAAVVFRAGAQTVPLTSDKNHLAKVATDPVPAWRAENAAVAESDPTFSRVTFDPKSLSVLIKVSRELLEDTLNIETALPNLLSTALSLELDRASLFGSGVAPQPKGVVNFTGLTTNTFAGGALTSYAPLVKARTALRSANADAAAYILHPRDEGKLAELADSTGQTLAPPRALDGVQMLTTTAVPTNGGVGTNESSIVAGDFSRLMIGIRSEIRIEVLRERFADNLQYGFLAFLRADVAAEHEAAFTKLGAITP